MFTEILGCSIQTDLNYIASRLRDAPEGAKIVFVGMEYTDIVDLKSADILSLVKIDVEDEKKYRIVEPNRPDLDVTFTIVRHFSHEADYAIFLSSSKSFNIDYDRFLEIAKSVKKVFLLTVLGEKPRIVEAIRENLGKKLEIIEISVPESWLED